MSKKNIQLSDEEYSNLYEILSDVANDDSEIGKYHKHRARKLLNRIRQKKLSFWELVQVLQRHIFIHNMVGFD